MTLSNMVLRSHELITLNYQESNEIIVIDVTNSIFIAKFLLLFFKAKLFKKFR